MTNEALRNEILETAIQRALCLSVNHTSIKQTKTDRIHHELADMVIELADMVIELNEKIKRIDEWL